MTHAEWMPLVPLPEGLGDRFLVGDALRRDVPRGRLDGKSVEAPFHGVRVSVGRDRVGPESRSSGSLAAAHLDLARSYAVRMGHHEFFSHLTAAVIYGIPLPPGLLRAAPLHVSVLSPQRLPRSRGVRGHEAMPALTGVVRDPVTGLRVMTPATTWASLGAMLRMPYDLIAAGDAFVRDWRTDPLTTIEQLTSAVAAGRRVGRPALREALPRIRSRSASRPETHARLLLCDAGLPEPELNFDVRVDRGELCVDLAYPAMGIAIEYEGEHHLLDPEQWARDIDRYERLAAAGWLVIRVTKVELFGMPQRFIARVRAARRQRA